MCSAITMESYDSQHQLSTIKFWRQIRWYLTPFLWWLCCTVSQRLMYYNMAREMTKLAI